MKCPECGSERCVKCGYSPKGKQRFMCRGCGIRFIPGRRNRIHPECRRIMKNMLEMDLAVPVISQATGIDRTTVYYHRRQMRAAVRNGC